MNALYIIPILAVLILIHEIGHFVTARLVGIRVQEFGIGIPPRLFGFRRGDVLYSVNLLPIGGFVRVLGEDGKSFAPDSMQSKTKLQRALFLSAGSLMNVLLAFVLVTILVGVQGESRSNVYVSEVEPESPAAQAGWRPGDRFVIVGGETVSSVDSVVDTTEGFVGKPMPVTIERGGQLIETEVLPREDPPPGRGRTGIRVSESPEATITAASVEPGSAAADAGIQADDEFIRIGETDITDAGSLILAIQNNAGTTVPLSVRRDGQLVQLDFTIPSVTPAQTEPPTGLRIAQDVKSYPIAWWRVVPQGAQETVRTVQRMFQGLGLLVRGDVPISGVAGPIGMGQLTSEVLRVSAAPAWVTLTNIMILLSLNLAILNLLPFPALDGGRLLFVLIESIRGKRVSPEKEGMVHFVGMMLLLVFMLVVAFVDIDRVVSGQSLLR